MLGYDKRSMWKLVGIMNAFFNIIAAIFFIGGTSRLFVLSSGDLNGWIFLVGAIFIGTISNMIEDKGKE